MNGSTESNSVEERFRVWAENLNSEVHFWNDWFSTKGSLWPEDFRVRFNPDREFPHYLVEKFPNPETTRILDVGSGPVTGFGFMYKGSRLNISACDPLAYFYNIMMEKHHIHPPIPTEVGFSEELSSFFAPGSFDLICCSNALDHSFEPIRGIEEMLIVARLGGIVFLTHHINEASSQPDDELNYQGLHQWNFDAEDGEFIIWNRNTRINVSEKFASIADVYVHYDPPNNYISVYFTKKAELAADLLARYRARIVELLPATMLAAYHLVNSR